MKETLTQFTTNKSKPFVLLSTWCRKWRSFCVQLASVQLQQQLNTVCICKFPRRTFVRSRYHERFWEINANINAAMVFTNLRPVYTGDFSVDFCCDFSGDFCCDFKCDFATCKLLAPWNWNHAQNLNSLIWNHRKIALEIASVGH